MARIQIDDALANRARKNGLDLKWFCSRKLREECERMEYDRKSQGKD